VTTTCAVVPIDLDDLTAQFGGMCAVPVRLHTAPAGTVIDHLVGGGLPSIPLHPFPAAQNPGHERVGQVLRFCLSNFVIIKAVPARTRTASLLKLHNSSLIEPQERQ
jgi:hypothetical protein